MFSAINIFTGHSSAQWTTDGALNTAVITDINRQNSSSITTDGIGGAIITWLDYDISANDYNIYAQRLNATGVREWGTRGLPICTTLTDVHNPKIASDGNGGALIAWFDKRNVKNEVFVQKVNRNGVVQWTTDGVAVGTTPDHYQQGSQVIVSDGSGGAIVAWADWRGDFYNPVESIRAQRISASGAIMWGAGGVALNGIDGGDSPQIISDGNGGAVVCWDQWTGIYPAGNRDIFAQKINGSGAIEWGVHGVTVCDQTSEQRFPMLAPDGNGGAIIAWEDYRNGSYTALHAQRVNAGVAQWTTNGIRLTSLSSGQYYHRMMSDGNNGAYIVWQFASGVSVVQRISASGGIMWADGGVSFSDLRSSINPDLTTDQAGGVIITWDDGVNYIMAQRVNSSGTCLWAPRGAYICWNTLTQYYPRITTDGNGGAIIVWDDLRNDAIASTDIYAQQVAANGSIGIVTAVSKISNPAEAATMLCQNFPNPFSGETTISFNLATAGQVTLKVYSMSGQEIVTLVNSKMEPGSYSVTLEAEGLPEGIYYYRLKAGNESATKSMVIMKND